MEKHGAGAIQGIQSHNERERKSYTNPDIDSSKTHLNYSLISPEESYMRAIKANIAELNLKKAVRKDAVLACSFVITSSQDFFKDKTQEEQKSFFTDTVKFFQDRYGEKNVISAKVHMDEATPHMHLILTPIRDNKLSAKAIFGREELRHLQTELHASVGRSRGLQRGIEGSSRVHLSENRFKAEKALEAQHEAENKLQIAEEKLQRMEPKILKAEEVSRIKGQKTLFGALKGVSYQEFESLKLTAGKVDELADRTQRAENNAQEARAKLQENLTWVEKEKKLIEDEKKRLAVEKEKTPDRFLLKRNQELSQENQALKTVLTYAKAFIRNLPKEFIKLLPEHQQERLVKIAETSKSLDKSQGLGR